MLLSNSRTYVVTLRLDTSDTSDTLANSAEVHALLNHNSHMPALALSVVLSVRLTVNAVQLFELFERLVDSCCSKHVSAQRSGSASESDEFQASDEVGTLV